MAGRTTADAISSSLRRGRGALIGYLPAGFPDRKTSIEAAVALAEHGADAIEIGLPYSDPVMDGGIIQAAASESLRRGFRTPEIFGMITEIRERVDIPLLVMTYANPVEQFGVQRFARELSAAGGSGLVTPDLTPTTAQTWIEATETYELERIFLAAPTSSRSRLDLIGRASRGFVYAASTMGVTGARADVDDGARELVARVRATSDRHVCVGIGLSTQQHVSEVLEYADGAIVGSALVHALATSGVEGVSALAANLRQGTLG